MGLSRHSLFALDPETVAQPSAFEISFIREGLRYQYGIEVTPEYVISEQLRYWPKGREVLLYHRRRIPETNEEEYQFGASLKGQNERIRQLTRANALFLSVASTFNHPRLSGIYLWFVEQMKGIQMPLLQYQPFAIREDTELHERTRQLLRFADLGIDDYEFTEMPAKQSSQEAAERPGQDEGKNSRRFRVDFFHHTHSGRTIPIPLELESNGTRNLFGLCTSLFESLDLGSVLFIDELDASIHPVLARALIQLFHNPETNPHNAQLIFNTHDTTLLDRALFRRDQIWFTEKKGRWRI